MKLIIIGLLIFLVRQSASEARIEMEQLQGSWSMVGGMHRDIDISAGSFKGHSVPKPTLTITGDRWSFKFPPPYDRNPHTVTGTYTLSPNINPKGIDLIKGKQISRSLYIVRGDILTICYGLNDVTERPKSFDNCISDGLIVISYKKLPAK